MKQTKTLASGFPVMLDEERAKYVAREVKYEETIESLRRQLENERARDIHSCGPDCTRSGCVNRRLREELAAIQAREQQLLEKVHLALTVNYSREFADNRAAILQEALALQSDATALSAMIAKAS